MASSRKYMIDLYGGLILSEGWIARLRSDWMSLGWYEEPNRHRAFLPRVVASEPSWKPETFSGLSLSAVLDAEVLSPIRPATPREVAAGLCVKFGRIARAAGHHKPVTASVPIDVADGYIDPANDMTLVISMNRVSQVR